MLDYLGLEGAVGLTDALIGRSDVFDLVQPYGGTNLWVLGAGPIPPNPSELLGSTAMRSLLTHLASRFDYVVIDSPPTLPVTDAVVLSSLVDGVIVVVGSGVVQRDQLVQTLENLESVAGPGARPGAQPDSGGLAAGAYGTLRVRHARGLGDPPRAQAGRAGRGPAGRAVRGLRPLSGSAGLRRRSRARTIGTEASSISAAICAKRAAGPPRGR